MDVKDQSVIRRTGQAAERRAYPRQPICLPSVFTLSGGGSRHQCEIRDFCPLGMLLVYGPTADLGYQPTIGDVIHLEASLSAGTGAKTVTFTARVVRTDGHSAGVALIDPDASALQAVQAFATEQAAAAPLDQSYLSDANAVSNKAAQAIITEFRSVYVYALGPIMQAFVERADERFFELAKNATSVSAQNGYFSTQGMIKQAFQNIKHRFLAAVNSHIREADLRCGKSPDKANPASTGMTLTLMEHDMLEDWLAISDVVNHVESKHQSVLSEIERRLSHLHRAPISREDNPVGPRILAQSFEEAIAQLSLEHHAKQVCFTLFKAVLNEQLPQLYAKLNNLLIEAGVLPYLKPEFVRQAGSQPSSKSDTEVHGPVAAPADTEESASNVAAPAAAGTASRNAPHVQSAEPTYGGRGAEQGHDLYQIVRGLRELQQRLNQGPVSPGAASEQPLTHPMQGAQPHYAVYDQHEILAALSHMQSTTGTVTDSQPRLLDFQSRVIFALQARSPGDAKQLGERESGIVDVASTLFDSMLQDMLVAQSVRRWLQRLEIPILKLAIIDDTLFLDRSHTARQVVNRISQLELYGDGTDRTQSAIERKVDSLIDRIANNVDADPGVFANVLRELDVLIQLQNEAYADNLRDLIAQCENEEALASDVTPAAGEPDRDHRDEWIKRTHRLQIGSWLLLESNSSDQQRVRLAWKSKHQDRYVFANLRGLREAALGVAELAKRLHDGTAIILDSADEPAIDRAQYTMLQTLHRKLMHESTHDQLTGLINRREFERRFREAVNTIVDSGDKHCLCYMDIDQFSVINATCGYKAGDRLLVEISELISNNMSNHAVVARLGSDEFAILMEGLPVRDAIKIIEDLIGEVRSYRFTWQDKRFSVSFSIGMVQVDGQENVPAALLQAAESSCRAARDRGVNKIHIYRSDDSQLFSRSKTAHWLSSIDKALDEGVLDLRYQRILPLQDNGQNSPMHAEILLSVIDEGGEQISPQEFIVAAEHYNRIAAVDRLVIQTVFRWLVQHKGGMSDIDGFSINLSGRSISDETFLGFVLDEAKKTGVPMAKICFEVTETAGISNLSDATEFILQMKKAGCQFSLDDFGSGYSSYTYLKNLPVDFLKIDGAFVREMDKNPSDFAVVKSISEIGHFMGKKIIAEAVENKTVLNRLREIGVDYAQGFIIEKPQPLEQQVP
jgi:diguanylate cyclase (GGDEF)-like protein